MTPANEQALLEVVKAARLLLKQLDNWAPRHLLPDSRHTLSEALANLDRMTP